MTDRITKEAMDYATSIIEDPEEHHDAVFSTANDFSQGANWMMDCICEFLKGNLHIVDVYTDGKTGDVALKEEKIVFVEDNSPLDFIERLRKSMLMQ